MGLGTHTPVWSGLMLVLLAVVSPLSVILPLRYRKLRVWLASDPGMGDKATGDARQRKASSMIRQTWYTGAVPERVGLVRDKALPPVDKASLEQEHKEREYMAEHQPTSAAITLEKAKVQAWWYAATHVTPALGVQYGDEPDTLKVVLKAVPPITVKDITDALAAYGTGFFGFGFDMPVVDETDVRLVLHLQPRESWAQAS
ncbi:hypothetical protein OZX72_02145 [Bifidobacterium sp. ESL0769]|uniref:hypothetical protein n=1 Tax=Bifidobacterium sp. ESL0769 TaxID=2983229 RepID=UPI0023F8CB4C|nr:hypothetical protein [Bifidobacterium sp. ESL0769]WEV67816.1 hypothetical protein OZX72_02145 [Bifidobacterium sp. ESL0769]